MRDKAFKYYLVLLLSCATLFGCETTRQVEDDQVHPRLPGDSPKMFQLCEPFEDSGYRNGRKLPAATGTPGFTFGPGRFVITEQIHLESGTVLSGAGPDRTTLFFPGGLMDLGIMCPNRKDCWSWSNGLVQASGTEVGIQNLTLEFPAHTFEHYGRTPGEQRGFNGIEFVRCYECWASNVNIINSDVGVLVRRSKNVTIDDTRITANEDGSHIHYAISTYSENILISNFVAVNDSNHGLTAQWGAHGAYVNGTLIGGVRLEPEHNGPVARTLYENISGDVDSIQSTNRSGGPVNTSFVNVNGQKSGLPCSLE